MPDFNLQGFFIQIIAKHKPVIFTTIGNGRDIKNIQDHGRKKKFATSLTNDIKLNDRKLFIYFFSFLFLHYTHILL